MKRYKVKKVFRDARSNEIYGAGNLISLSKERHAEIVSAIGEDYLDLVPENPEQTHEIVQEEIEKATAPLIAEIERLKHDLKSGQQELDNDESSGESTEENYPKMLSRGKYELSNGNIFEGSKTAATEAENALEK